MTKRGGGEALKPDGSYHRFGAVPRRAVPKRRFAAGPLPAEVEGRHTGYNVLGLQCSGCRVEGFRFRVIGFRVWGLGLGIQGFHPTPKQARNP